MHAQTQSRALPLAGSWRSRYIIGKVVSRHIFDAEYVHRLVLREEDAERHFTAYFSDLLNAKLRSRLRSPHLVEDVRQETFLRVLKTIRQNGGVAEPGALGAFVNSVCNNILFELYRTESKAGGLLEDRESGEASAEGVIADEEERAEVRDVVSSLPDKDRTILQWLFFEERDKDEVCRLLSVDREYLRVLIHRAKTRFRSDFLKRKKAPASAGSQPLKFKATGAGEG